MPIQSKLLRLFVIPVLITVIAFITVNPESFAASENEGSAVAGSDEKSGEETGQPEEKEELTLWKVIALGGKLMYLLAFLSFLTIVLITFYFLSLSPATAAPPIFAKKVHEMMSNKRTAEAKMFCSQNDNILSRILLKGLAAIGKERYSVSDAVRNEGERQASILWQRISYLADIAIVAPMVGLLGTTVGMMHTFMEMRTSLAIGGVKPAAMAGGIFEAMVTTVAGLIIAILATGFYAYFRGIVQRMIRDLEEITTEYAELIEGGHEK